MTSLQAHLLCLVCTCDLLPTPSSLWLIQHWPCTATQAERSARRQPLGRWPLQPWGTGWGKLWRPLLGEANCEVLHLVKNSMNSDWKWLLDLRPSFPSACLLHYQICYNFFFFGKANCEMSHLVRDWEITHGKRYFSSWPIVLSHSHIVVVFFAWMLFSCLYPYVHQLPHPFPLHIFCTVKAHIL